MRRIQNEQASICCKHGNLSKLVANEKHPLCLGTVKLGDKERFDKEQIGVKEPFPVTNCQFTS